jgi:hypothetical protein
VWVSILDGELRDAARTRLAKLVDHHIALPLAEDRFACSLMTGDVGRALFLAYTGEERAREHAAAILVNAAERIEIVSDLPTFHAGFTGCAWALEHLAKLVDLPPDANDAIDAAVREFLVTRPAWLAHEWLIGAAGFTLYAAERRNTALLRALLGYFEASPELARKEVGVAHGVAGVIAALCTIAAAQVEPVRALALADRHTAWLLDEPRSEGSERPQMWCTWCAGDLGIATTLATCGLRFGRGRLLALAADLAAQIARRLDGGERPAVDGSICHGWAGNAHMLARLATLLADDRVARAARRAFELALGATTDEGDDSLLTGTAGLGLVLLAATTDTKPAWDRALLLSVGDG